MATDKLFTVAGVSTLDGETKVRFANDTLRLKVLMKHGHTDPILVELPEAMTKLAAVKFIKGLDEFAGVQAQSAIADYLDRKDEAPKAKVSKPVAKATKTPVAKTTKAPAKAVKVTEDEDAPF